MPVLLGPVQTFQRSRTYRRVSSARVARSAPAARQPLIASPASILHSAARSFQPEGIAERKSYNARAVAIVAHRIHDDNTYGCHSDKCNRRVHHCCLSVYTAKRQALNTASEKAATTL